MDTHLPPYGALRRYEQVLLLRVLLGDAEAREAFLEQTIGLLQQQLHGAMLVETVIAYAQ